MSEERELLRRLLEICNAEDWDTDSNFDELLADIRTFLEVEPEAEPVAWIQPNHLEKAQFMPFLCRVEPKQRDDFIPIYAKPEPSRKPLPEKIDPILRSARGVRYSPNYVAGWNNCIDAMSNGAEARKPMTEDKPAVFRYKEDPSDLRSRWLYATKEKSIPNGFPYESLYRNPPKPEPARKPIPEEKIDAEIERQDCYAGSFKRGIRFAEKHHQIGINKSDPDSIDLQSRCRGDKL
jgi:hypothetical protein